MPEGIRVLQPFSFNARVKASDARQDKINIKCRHFLIFNRVTSVEYINFIQSCVSFVEESELDDFLNEDEYMAGGVRGWIFRRPPTDPSLSHDVSKSAQRLRQGSLNPPLFGGGYTCKAIAPETYSANLRIELNPTRFARHQLFGSNLRMLSESDGWQELRFLKSPPIYTNEYSLDVSMSDNWVPNTPPYQQVFLSERNWNGLLRQYIKGTFEHIEGEFQRAASIQGTFVVAPTERRFHLHKVETYFEFEDTDPIDTVKRLYPLLQSYSEREVTRTDYPVARRAGVSNEVSHNSQSLGLHIQNGIHLKIYAKTDKRIRFEVRHDLNKFTAFNQNRRVRVPILNDCFPFLDMARANAAQVVNRVIEHMQGQRVFPTNSATVHEFLARFIKALDGFSGEFTLLSMLVHNHRIVIDEEIRDQVRALREAGILEAVPRNNRRLNILTARYRRAIELLGRTEFSILGFPDK